MAGTRLSEEVTLDDAHAVGPYSEASREPVSLGKSVDSVELVTFDEDDPEDPKNWSILKKNAVIVILCVLSFTSVFGSSSYAPGENQVQEMFGVNADVASVGLTVYVLGFAFGPLLCPMSEIYGRRLAYMISWPLLIAVIAPSAWVDNIVVIMIFRFLAGCCSACALNNGSGIISDMYASTPQKLQKAIGFYAFCPLSGPIVGSIVGFFVAAHLTHGLWVIRVHWFFVIAVWPLIFAIPETHGLTILAHRARKIRAEGGGNAYAAHELHTMSKREFLQRHIGRPIMMLTVEPIIIGAAIWVSLAYSIIYFFFEVYPVVFVEQNHISSQLGGLPFIGLMIGMFICLLTMGPVTQLSRKISIPFVDPPVTGTPADAPEAGLKVALIGCVLMPISLFWFAWTSRGNVHWISPALAGIFFGYSMLVIFYTFLGYCSRTYQIYASSATASNTLARSIVASFFPVVAHPIIKNLGTAWGVSLFGFLSLGLVPIPILFIRYGPVLREKSFFAREAKQVMDGMRRNAEVLVLSDSEKKEETTSKSMV